MPNYFEEKITAQNVKIIYEENERKPFVGEMFFKPVKQNGLDINMIKGRDDKPTALVSANFDTDVLYRDRIEFESLTAEMPYFKEAYKVDEKLRQEIIMAQEQYRSPLINRIYSQLENLVLGADVTAERLRMQILSTGTISIQENGVDKQYDYGFDTSKQIVTEATLWSAAGAKPLSSFIAQIKKYKKLTGKAAKFAIMNDDVFEKLAESAEVTNYFSNLSTPNLFPTNAAKKAYIEQTSEITIIIANDEYVKARDKSKSLVAYYPQDRYTLVSTLDLGETVYGTTPEEADLLVGNSQVLSGEIIGNGIAVTTWKEPDPVGVNTKVSEVCLPSCPLIDKVYIVKVLS